MPYIYESFIVFDTRDVISRHGVRFWCAGRPFGCEGLKHRPLTVGGVAYALSLGSRV